VLQRLDLSLVLVEQRLQHRILLLDEKSALRLAVGVSMLERRGELDPTFAELAVVLEHRRQRLRDAAQLP
jgi:hypothetical protein